MDQNWEETQTGMDKNGLGRRLYLPRSIFSGHFSQVCNVVSLVLFYQWPLCHMDDALTAAKWHSETAAGTVDTAKPEEPSAPGLSSNPTQSPKTPPAIPILPDLPFEGTPSMGCSILWVPCWPFLAKVELLSQWLIWWSSWKENPDCFPRGGG